MAKLTGRWNKRDLAQWGVRESGKEKEERGQKRSEAAEEE